MLGDENYTFHFLTSILNLSRITIRTVMCFLLLAGQIPGWIHVSTCGGTSGFSLVGSDSSHCCCCSASHSPGGSNTQKTVVSSAEPKQSHDCDACVICRSLMTHNAAQGNSFEFVEYEYSVEPISDLYQQFVPSKRLSLAQPRAPPFV